VQGLVVDVKVKRQNNREEERGRVITGTRRAKNKKERKETKQKK